MKYARLLFANLFRKKTRLTLTLGSFAVALFLFGFLGKLVFVVGLFAELVGAAWDFWMTWSSRPRSSP